jgi:hypothetical protein
MKCLMNAMAVALTITMPAWAQTPTMPAQNQPVAGPGASGGTRIPHHRVVRSGDHMADQLNREEMTTLQGGTPVHRMPGGGKQLTQPGN